MDASKNPSKDAALDKCGRPTADPYEFIRTFLQIESAYHNHKEQMAYVIATLYLAAAGYLLTAQTVPFLGNRSFFFAAAVLAIAGVGFVYWQLRNRRGAHVNATAAYRLMGRWHILAPTDDELTPDTAHPNYRRYGWPRVLVREIGKAREDTWRDDRSLLVAELLTLGLLIAVGTAAVVHIANIITW
jgi:hypothetical protein